jgi:hypothetical protein
MAISSLNNNKPPTITTKKPEELIPHCLEMVPMQDSAEKHPFGANIYFATFELHPKTELNSLLTDLLWTTLCFLQTLLTWKKQ